MSRVKYAMNPTFIESWAPRVGKLILNFSCLEFESYLWLVQMSEQPERIQEFTTKRFKSRGDAIIQFVEVRAFSDQWKIDAHTAWCAAIELAKLRNQIAHNPLVFGWADEAEEGEPDFIGVADRQAPKQPAKAKGPFMSKADIDLALNRIAELVQQLASLRLEWCKLRDERDENVDGEKRL